MQDVREIDGRVDLGRTNCCASSKLETMPSWTKDDGVTEGAAVKFRTMLGTYWEQYPGLLTVGLLGCWLLGCRAVGLLAVGCVVGLLGC